MITRVQKWGNSLAFRLPKAFADGLGLAQGSKVALSLEEGSLVVRPDLGRSWDLDSLLAEVTGENIHSDWETEEPQGEADEEGR